MQTGRSSLDTTLAARALPDDMVVDAFERLTPADDRQAMLSLELHHRVQNTLETLPGAAPRAKGAGSGLVLIERLARDLGGSASLAFKTEGLAATITFKSDPKA